MFKDAGARGGATEGAHAADLARKIDQHQLARLDFADQFGPDHVESDGFRSEHDRLSHPPHHQRPNTKRVAAGDHAFGRHHDQRIGALDQPQGIHQPVSDGGIAAGGNEVDDHLGVRGRLEDRSLADKIAAQHHCVRDIAIVRHGKSAAGKIGIKRLDVPEARSPGGRIAHMARCHMAGQGGDGFGGGEFSATWPRPRLE